ncbi:MAG: hypothetical protein EOO07_14575 [Chitinophagaceae bacterium]|nr:MAG: hypothetical protein EOO07_14575 [Chitinophagaceae bacterium]
MNYERKSLRTEQGSMHRKASRITNPFGLIPSPKSNYNHPALKTEEQEVEYQTNEEEISPSSKARRNPWNSATFDNDDFYGGFSLA